MQQISFTVKDGFCPFFASPNGDTYIIYDRKNSTGYEYELQVKKKKPEVMTFETKADADSYIQKKTERRRYDKFKSENKTAYFLYDVTLVCDGLSITHFYTPDFVAGPFESYDACLNYAKEFISSEIKKSEREQIALF